MTLTNLFSPVHRSDVLSPMDHFRYIDQRWDHRLPFIQHFLRFSRLILLSVERRLVQLDEVFSLDRGWNVCRRRSPFLFEPEEKRKSISHRDGFR